MTGRARPGLGADLLRFGPACAAALALVFVPVVLATVGLVRAGVGAGEGLSAIAIGDPYVLAALRFTLLQAVLSTVLSVGLAIPVARALARQRFRGRNAVLTALGLPLLVPSLVGALAVLAVWGRGGWLADAAMAVGFDWRPDIYGLPGILIAHVFFNLPLAVRVLVQAWGSIPGETWRVAAQLGMGPRAIARLIERPLLMRVVPGLAGLVFLLCFTSFAIVLTLGGGPAAATLEVTIYQSLAFDYAPARAATLAAIQVTICTAIVVVIGLLGRPFPSEAVIGLDVVRPDAARASTRLVDCSVMVAAGLFVGSPLAAIIAGGAFGPWLKVLALESFWRAAGFSAAISLASGTLTTLAGFAIAAGVARLRVRHWQPGLAGTIETAAAVTLAIPPLALGAGLFLALRGTIAPSDAAMPVIVSTNVLMALPFAVRILGPALAASEERYGKLARSLGVSGLRRVRLVDLPESRRACALAFAVAAAVSFGDFGVVALFGSEGVETLPHLLSRFIGSYRLGEAWVVAAAITAVGVLLFAVADRLVRR